MLEIQQLMHQGLSYEELYNRHGVVAKPYNGKVSYCYDMLAAKDSDPVAKQCRGLILEEGTWKLLAYPFDRFFNHGQGEAAEIDLQSAAFEEKLDGTLIIGYFHNGRWHCATRQMCEAHGDINGIGTFARLVDKASNLLGYQCFHELMFGCFADNRSTYMFELISPYNKIVCDYDKLDLVCLGARNNLTYREFIPDFPMRYPKTWKLSSIDDMLEVMHDWSPLEYEGVILKDYAYRRVKIKTPQYVAMAHASESLAASWRAIATCVLSGCADDMLPKVVPTIQARLQHMQIAVNNLIHRIQGSYDRIKHIDDMKEFASYATQMMWSAPLFAVKRGKAESISAYIKNAHVDTVLEYLKKNGWNPDAT